MQATELSKTYPDASSCASSDSCSDYQELNYSLQTYQSTYKNCYKKIIPTITKKGIPMLTCLGIFGILGFLIVKYGGNPEGTGERDYTYMRPGV